MQKRKIIVVALVVAVVVVATVGYEFFVANSLSGYTKVTLTPLSIAADYQPCSIKFGNTVYYITFFFIQKNGFPSPSNTPNPVFQVTTEQTLIINSNESFGAIQGDRYSFEGLRIVVGSVNSNQLILYVKSTISSSEPIISPMATSPVSPLPTPYQSSPVSPLPTPYSSIEPSNEVVVSGTVSYCQNGTITFSTPNYQWNTFITDSKYTELLLGGQSYNVTISYQGAQGEEMQFAKVNVPSDVTYFTANF
jgi:hypothetical protein